MRTLWGVPLALVAFLGCAPPPGEATPDASSEVPFDKPEEVAEPVDVPPPDARSCGVRGIASACAMNEVCSGGVCRPYCRGDLRFCPPNRCVDALVDPANCGACGRVCASGSACCDGACVDLASSRAHCGACGRACDAGERCAAGSCVACEGGGAFCGDACVDLRRSPAHCGACGRVCASGTACCDGACIDVQSDPMNCGACGPACASGTACCGGACVDLPSNSAHCGACGRACASGSACCGGACVDVQSDPARCGGCGVACASGNACCGGACADLASSRAHCGDCGRACGAGERCAAGRCVACEGGGAFCGGACVDLRRSPAHCGACDRSCVSSDRCVEGVCVACPPGMLRCGEACTDVSSAREHCGGCGNVCAVGARCVARQCVAACGSTADCAAGATCLEGYCAGPTAYPRAPISASVTKGARPWFRWRLPMGADGARVEVCATRACERPVARWDAAGEALRAPVALAPGVYFWRLFVRRGAAMHTSPSDVWEFVVPPRPSPDVYVPPPRGLQVFSDFNGDGVADVAEQRCVDGAGCGLWVRYGRAAGVTPLPDLELPSPPPTDRSSDGWWSGFALVAPMPIGDIDRDGYGDLLVTLAESRYQWAALRAEYSLLRVYLGGAAGVNLDFRRFNDLRLVPGSTGRAIMPIGDRNGDGYGDLGVWGLGFPPERPWYAEFGGGAPPTWSGVSAPEYEVPMATVVDVGDFNADGASDLVVTMSPTSSAVGVWNAYGRLDVVVSCRWGIYSGGGQSWTIGDTNDDGFDDIDLTWGDERAPRLGDAGGGRWNHTCP